VCVITTFSNTPQADRPRVLCVDDEPYILESLRDTLRKRFDVRTAGSGLEGLVLLEAEPEKFALIISDMRMPVMPGSIFLREARRRAPDATRILLTGYADLDAAVEAVNEAHLFRFLTKPCPAAELLATCTAALDHHNLKAGERVLLEQTLHGSVKALVDVLSLASPAAFGRSARVRKLVAALAAAVVVDDRWEVEVSALLVNIGAVTLPPETAEKLYSGAALTPAEQRMVTRVPKLTRRILENIPRLEGVIEILDCYERSWVDTPGQLPLGARILRLALDFDELDAQGADHDLALATMRGRGLVYDPELIEVFAGVVGGVSVDHKVHEIGCRQLCVGMILASDVRSDSGGLLIARGHTVTDQLIERLLNLRVGSVREPVMIVEGDTDVAPDGADSSSAATSGAAVTSERLANPAAV
jgi:response regulator RpfG family c-di-GMP phosphodiesterase